MDKFIKVETKRTNNRMEQYNLDLWAQTIYEDEETATYSMDTTVAHWWNSDNNELFPNLLERGYRNMSMFHYYYVAYFYHDVILYRMYVSNYDLKIQY